MRRVTNEQLAPRDDRDTGHTACKYGQLQRVGLYVHYNVGADSHSVYVNGLPGDTPQRTISQKHVWLQSLLRSWLKN